MKPKYLFIGGVPRSGTTALLELLNGDDRFIIGTERFKFIQKTVSPDNFTESAFFSPVKEETDLLNYDRYYAKLHERYKSGSCIYMGDKDPGWATQFEYLSDTFHDARLILLYRNLFAVANSFNVRASDPEDGWPEKNDYTAAPAYWKGFYANALKFASGKRADKLFVVKYESFYSGSEGYLDALYKFLELDVTENVRDAFRATTNGWEKRNAKPTQLNHEMETYLEEHRDKEIEKALDDLSFSDS
jgi:hypothetical protein